MKYSDEEIIEGIRSDNRDVLNVFYKLNFEMIRQFVSLNGGDEDEAKDIFQEAVLIIYHKIKNNSLVLNCKLKTYLYSVSRNLWLKQLDRKDRNAGKVEDHEEFISLNAVEVVDWSEQQEKFLKMRESLDQIGEPCKTLINDFYIKNLSMNQITEKFGYSGEDSTKTQKYKCMNRLKKIFFELYTKQKD